VNRLAVVQARLDAELRLNRMSSASMDELSAFVIDAIGHITRSPYCLIGLVNDDGTSLTVYHMSPGDSRPAICRRTLRGGILWSQAAVDFNHCCLDLGSSAPPGRGSTWPDTCPNDAAGLVVPIIEQGMLTAVVGAARKDPPFDKDDTAVLRQLGEGCCRVIHRRRTVYALAESEKRYRLLVESMSEGLGIFDENCRITFVNDRFCRMLDYRPDELTGQSAAAILDETSQDIFYEQIARKTDEDHNPYEVDWIARAGEQVPTLVSPQPLFDNAGNFVGSIAVVTDIATLKRTEESLRETNAKLEAEQAALTEKNIALKEVLAQIEGEKDNIRKHLQTNVDRVLMPVIRTLGDQVGDRAGQYVKLLESCLVDITSPFVSNLEIRYGRLSPREIEICNMTRNGIGSKEIAASLNTSVHTVHNQRKQIRRKLGIANKDVNLVSFLQSFAANEPSRRQY
jgi:PAS domain S-box-containing protein